MSAKNLLALILVGLLPPLVLFAAAGRLDWIMGWAYVALTYLITLLSRLLMLRIAPDMVAERSRLLDEGRAPGWDRAIVAVIGIFGPLALALVAGLDRRLAWSEVPLALQLLGLAGLLAGGALSIWAMAVNRYFSSVVRIQQERGQTVVTSGPYRFVRHPGYASAVLSFLAIPLMLGSWWALIVSGVVVALYVLRTALEDRLLQAELDGYPQYAGKVRFRLLPGVW